MKRYKITMPTPDECIAKGLKFEGQEVRTRLWLMGVCSGVSFCRQLCPNRFNMILSGRQGFTVETNSAEIIQQVEDYLFQYGIKVEEVPPTIANCPSCKGEREISRYAGSVPIYKCYFCGMETT